MWAFAERARRELIATGEHVRKRGVDNRDALTPQEEQIARLARKGHSNQEISTQLFLSPRTVEWHLRKVSAKLGIASRRELRQAMALGVRTATPSLATRPEIASDAMPSHNGRFDQRPAEVVAPSWRIQPLPSGSQNRANDA